MNGSLRGEIDALTARPRVLSAEQAELAELNWDGRPQIVRGVAGSGKTLVLAHNLARRVARCRRDEREHGHPPRRVAAVCFNRSLVPLIKSWTRECYTKLPSSPGRGNGVVEIAHVNRFLFKMSRREGGPLTYCRVNADDPEDARRRAGHYLDQVADLRPSGSLDRILWDTIYVDEGQDCTEEEYRLLLELLRPDPQTGEKNLVVFYDNAQNVYARVPPVWSSLGIHVTGGGRSRVMKECHRNTRQVVEFGMNVLLGSCAPEGVRVTTRAFADFDTLRRDSLVSEECGVVLVGFARRKGQRPCVREFPDRAGELDWVAGEVARMVGDEGVRPEEIMLLSERQECAEAAAAAVGRRFGGPIGFSCPHREEQKDAEVIRPGHVTSTTTRSAKGYDAPVVFLVGADTFPPSNEGRASFYVGCSRARVRLHVTGMTTPGTLLGESLAVAERLGGPSSPTPL
jgi:superfamily I DNA and RNA helicase